MADQASKVHVAINCCDLSKSIDFYRNLFGLEPSKVRTGYAKFDVTNPPLNQHPFTDAGALSHLGIQVASTEDVFAIREQWHQAAL
jgi:catechol 2,3-dioxygenase-like lactoylglutathione lyase family enzyme